MKIGVKVLPRQEVLDSQGRTVQNSLLENGFPIMDCKIGKYIVLDVEANSFEEAKAQVDKMAEFVLYNPLIENFEVEKL